LYIIKALEFIVLGIIAIELFALNNHTKIDKRIDEHLLDTEKYLEQSNTSLLALNEHMKRFDDHMTSFDNHMSKLDEHILKLDEHIIRHNDLISRLDQQIKRAHFVKLAR